MGFDLTILKVEVLYCPEIKIELVSFCLLSEFCIQFKEQSVNTILSYSP